MKLVMLGSGASAGVPRIGNDWGLCDPTNPRNRRRRTSILVEHQDIRLLVDSGPDVRSQLLDAGVGQVTAVLYTHDHADHTHGIDDLRPLFHVSGARVDCYMDAPTRASLTSRFNYIFEGRGGYSAAARALPIKAEMRFGTLTVRPFLQQHGSGTSVGYRFEADGKAIAYSTDVSHFPDDSFALLQGLNLWVVEALRREPHPTHLNLDKAIGWIARAQPREAWLTHMDGSMDHDSLLDELPEGVTPGYDGRIWDARK